MKEFWVDIRPFSKDLATAAIESGADVIITDSAGSVRELGRITTIAPDGDLKWGDDVQEVHIRDKETEEQAVALSRNRYVVVKTGDWTVIPLENMVAQSDRIIASVKTKEEAELALSVLEQGVRGILLVTDDPGLVRKVGRLVKATRERINIVPFTITAIRPVGMGDRVCVDTCSMLNDGEGMLTGNTSSAFLLIHAETLDNPYVAPRPFRVNAGAVHAYTLTPGGKTAYLSDLKAGDRVLVIDHTGDAREAAVGRIKIEARPLLLVEAESGNEKVSLVLQNAETIRLVAEDGVAVSVVALKAGDRVLGCLMGAGRHFGMAVKEKIIEK